MLILLDSVWSPPCWCLVEGWVVGVGGPLLPREGLEPQRWRQGWCLMDMGRLHLNPGRRKCCHASGQGAGHTAAPSLLPLLPQGSRAATRLPPAPPFPRPPGVGLGPQASPTPALWGSVWSPPSGAVTRGRPVGPAWTEPHCRAAGEVPCSSVQQWGTLQWAHRPLTLIRPGVGTRVPQPLHGVPLG